MSAVQEGYAGRPGTKAIFDEAESFMRSDRLSGYVDLAPGWQDRRRVRPAVPSLAAPPAGRRGGKQGLEGVTELRIAGST